MHREVNFDGLVGPTHNYAGLAPGNLHSTASARTVSHPKQAALQGIAKMRRLADLGLTQAVLPPQERPDLLSLRRLGFDGNDAEVLARAAEEAPALLSACYSASGMWAANAATFSPSLDSADGHAHITPANLTTLFHRHIEVGFMERLMASIFGSSAGVVVHESLPGTAALADEGAANHTRLCRAHGEPGLEFFVYGRIGIASGSAERQTSPTLFQGRQTREASEALARLHRLDPDRVVFAQQSPEAIDAGVFHNDVICVGNENVLLYHEQAFVDTEGAVETLRERFAALPGSPELCPIRVDAASLTLEAASSCYLFNSQIVSVPSEPGSMRLIMPEGCREHPSAAGVIDRIVAGDNPITGVEFVDVSESLKNGGGPACLRQRMVLSDEQIAAIRPRLLLDDALAADLEAWVNRHYRDTIEPKDLADPALATDSVAALDELSGTLELDPVYSFQLTKLAGENTG